MRKFTFLAIANFLLVLCNSQNGHHCNSAIHLAPAVNLSYTVTNSANNHWYSFSPSLQFSAVGVIANSPRGGGG